MIHLFWTRPMVCVYRATSHSLIRIITSIGSSKTEVIKWHKISRSQLLFSFAIWIISIAIHRIDVKTGIMFIALLSMLHVLMEFPLNHKSFISIGRMLGSPLRQI